LEIGANVRIPGIMSALEVVAHVRAQLRLWTSLTKLQVGSLELDCTKGTARLSGRAIALTKVEAHLLSAMMKRAGTVLTSSQLLEAVWGHESPVSPRNIRPHVVHLRRKLGDHLGSLVRCARGFGYCLDPEGLESAGGSGSPSIHQIDS
jgi:DNA-binding response OmpR family regulator